MPGLGEIESLIEALTSFLRTERVEREFDLLAVHSTILN